MQSKMPRMLELPPAHLSMSDACSILKQCEQRGMISGFGGARTIYPSRAVCYDSVWFTCRGTQINAHQFGIVSACFDVIHGMTMADEYDSWGKRINHESVAA